MNRPQFTITHANAKGTGSKMQMELVPARLMDVDGTIRNTAGGIVATFSPQKTIGGQGKLATFDAEAKIVVRLGFDDLCKMVQVFRGELESIADGKGLYHRNAKVAHIVRMSHQIEPVTLYKIEVVETDITQPMGDAKQITFCLSPSEALGVSLAIEGSLGLVTFGVPCVIQEGINYGTVSKEGVAK